MSLNCSSEVNRIDSNTVSIKYIVGGWLTLAFCVFGIITNIFTVVVLMHPRMRNSSTHVYLIALSVCNIFLLAGLIINYSVKSIASYPELLAYLRQPDRLNRYALLANAYEQFYARVAPFTTPLLSMLLLCSTYFTVLVSGDRYFLICWPLIAEKIRTRKMALVSVSIVLLLVNIYILPHWFEYKTTTRPNLIINNSTMNELVELTYTSLGSNKIYLKIFRVYLNIPVTFVIPFTLLTFCNGSMIRQLVLIKKKKKRLGQRMKADIRITIMLIVIVLTFMLCRSVNLFVNFLVELSPCLNNNALQRFNTFANLFIAFNGFVNFFLFAAFGQRFREMVLYIFFRHGHDPFRANLDGISTHRFLANVTQLPVETTVRPSSKCFPPTDTDAWTAITRRRSSASMAVLYNPSDLRQSNSSHLNIPSSSSNLMQKLSQNSNTLTIPSTNSNQNKTNSLENSADLHVTFV